MVSSWFVPCNRFLLVWPTFFRKSFPFQAKMIFLNIPPLLFFIIIQLFLSTIRPFLVHASTFNFFFDFKKRKFQSEKYSSISFSLIFFFFCRFLFLGKMQMGPPTSSFQAQIDSVSCARRRLYSFVFKSLFLMKNDERKRITQRNDANQTIVIFCFLNISSRLRERRKKENNSRDAKMGNEKLEIVGRTIERRNVKRFLRSRFSSRRCAIRHENSSSSSFSLRLLFLKKKEKKNLFKMFAFSLPAFVICSTRVSSLLSRTINP